MGRIQKRIGCSDQVAMHYNLQNLVQGNDLHQIEEAVTKEDIDRVIKILPLDKAPGPDSFNGAFLKKCWQDIVHLKYVKNSPTCTIPSRLSDSPNWC